MEVLTNKFLFIKTLCVSECLPMRKQTAMDQLLSYRNLAVVPLRLHCRRYSPIPVSTPVKEEPFDSPEYTFTDFLVYGEKM